jgi:DNA-binding transcriptional LysR family regulator
MQRMSNIDPLELDGRLLQLLVAVAEERSITRAAERLNVTQSAVSHGLDRLRAIVGDPLFVKAGRGIVATAHAEALAERARAMLDELRAFASGGHFDPSQLMATVRIAANPLQRDLLLPALLARLRAVAPRIALQVVPSDVPGVEMLRDERCHLVVSPRPPEAGDVLHKRLFEDRYRVFYDASERTAPADRLDYEAAEHVVVLHDGRHALGIDRLLAERGVVRRIGVQVADFSGVAPFVRGTRRLATLPLLLRAGLLRDLAHGAPPIECPGMPVYMIWHRRHQSDPMHQWLRHELEATVGPALEACGVDAG